jgi:predicted ribosome quality control (RQC) complex YloA/Tae2 family protein
VVVDEKLLQQMEQAPNIEQYKDELVNLQSRLEKLNWLDEQFNQMKSNKKQVVTAQELQKMGSSSIDGVRIIQLIHELDINHDNAETMRIQKIEMDSHNKRAKAEKAQQMKQQQQQQGVRLPYRRYYTEQRTEIRVGKQATDNDVLSLSPEHRSGSHWWYHASGCSGSHVILITDSSTPNDDDILDAASLAALKSKCIGQSIIKVSMTRARNVSKPAGAKPGLVQLSGDVRTITLRKSEVEKRCKRLEETVVVN